MTATLTEAQRLRQILTTPTYVRDGVKYWVGYDGDVYWFDEAEADHWCGFVEQGTKVNQFFGEKFELMPYQRDILRELMGWRHVETGLRRYRVLFLGVPRGNAKTLFTALVELGLISIDGEIRAQGYIHAAKEEQAKIMFSMQVDQVEYWKQTKPFFGEQFEVRAPKPDQVGGSIWHKPTQSFLRPLTSAKLGKHGMSTHVYAIDEWHEILSEAVEEALRTSTIKRTQPLSFYTTTAGNRLNTPAHRGWLLAEKVKLGHIKRDDMLVVIYRPEKGVKIDFIKDFEGAIKICKEVNPGWGISVNESVMRKVLKESIGDPVKEASVLQYHFNIWTTGGAGLIPLHKWEPLEEEYGEDDLLGQECYGGLDCASVVDTNAFVLLFPKDLKVTREVIQHKNVDGTFEEEEVFNVEMMCRSLAYFWAPEATIEKMQEQGWGWERYVADGFLRATEGEACDMNQIRDDILKLKKKFNIKEIGYDPREAYWLTQQLSAKGLTMTEVNQARANVSAPTKVLQQLVLRSMFRHNKNDLYTDHITNAICTVKQRLYLLEKPSEMQKIDGAAATVDALKVLISRPIKNPMKAAVW